MIDFGTESGFAVSPRRVVVHRGAIRAACIRSENTGRIAVLDSSFTHPFLTQSCCRAARDCPPIITMGLPLLNRQWARDPSLTFYKSTNGWSVVKVDDPSLESKGHCFGAVFDRQLCHQVLEMNFHRSLRAPDHAGDLLVAESFGGEAKHLDLSFREIGARCEFRQPAGDSGRY